MNGSPLSLVEYADLQHVGVKGPQAATWLRDNGINVPSDVYGVESFGSSGFVLRQGAGDLLFEDRLGSPAIEQLKRQLADGASGVYAFPRGDAAFSIYGERTTVLAVLSQSCGLDFRKLPAHRLVFTRVAGVNCCLMPTHRDSVFETRIWLDPSYADYLWDELSTIVRELGGGIVGPRVRHAAQPLAPAQP